MRVSEYLIEQPRYHVLVFSLLLIVLLGFVQFHFGGLLVLTPLYLIPVAVSAVALGREGGFMASLVSVLVWLIIDLMHAGTSHIGVWPYVNAAVGLAGFIFVAVMLANVKVAFAAERKSARTDELSGLLNKTFFLENAERMLGKCRIDKKKMTVAAVLMKDLAEFMEIAGTGAGDELIRIVGAVIKRIMRKNDLAGRHGENMFMIVMPDTDQTGILPILERMEGHLVSATTRNNFSMIFTIGAVTFIEMPSNLAEMRDTVYDFTSGAVSAEENTIKHRTIGSE
jgi:diguanylate cyclase (GGDEF)-like protein